MPKQPPKRFIAGAVCSKCYKIDKIVVFEDADSLYRECVSCGFLEQLGKEKGLGVPQADKEQQ
jgi:uncharacterized protein